jgi:hypothetical protein
MSVEALIGLCPPPTSAVDTISDGRLDEIQQRYGLVLADEYVAFGHAYGTGVFESAMHGIHIHNPFSRYYHKMVQDGRLVIGTFFSDEEASEKLRALGIDQRSIFSLGFDTDRTFFMWVTDSNPAQWRVMAIFPEWNGVEVFNCGLCEFLTGYFTSQLTIQGLQYLAENGHIPRYVFRLPEWSPGIA